MTGAPPPAAEFPGDLAGRSARSGAVRLAAQGAQVALGVGVGMALARLLTPRDFGLVAMVTTLIAFVGSFRDFGLPLATVHQERVDDRQLSALFWLNLRWNLLIALSLAALAPGLAWFYGEPRLVAITLVMALGVFGIGLSVQHESLLTRRLRFGALTAIELGALVTGSAVGIGAALAGAGYWALVLQFLVNLLAKSAALWAIGSWRPSRPAGRDGAPGPDLRAILAYSRQTTAQRIIAHIGRNLDRVLVGAVGGPAALGLYDRSYQWSIFPTAQVHGPLLGVAVASLSRLRHDPARYRAHCRLALLLVFSLCLPATAFMFTEATAVILLLLGDQWLAAVPIFRLLCLAAFANCATVVTKWLYLSLGETGRQLRWSLIATPVPILAVALGARWGAYGVALGFTGATCLLAYPSVAYCLKTSPLGLRDFLGVLWRPAVAAIAAAGALALARTLLPIPGALVPALALKLALFGGVYLALWAGLPGGWPLVVALLRSSPLSRARGAPRPAAPSKT